MSKEKLESISMLIDCGHLDKASMKFAEEFSDMRMLFENDALVEWKACYARLMAGLQNSTSVSLLAGTILNYISLTANSLIDIKFTLEELFKAFCECFYYDFVEHSFITTYFSIPEREISSVDVWYLRLLILSGQVELAKDKIEDYLNRKVKYEYFDHIKTINEFISKKASDDLSCDEQLKKALGVQGSLSIRISLYRYLTRKIKDDNLSLSESISLQCYPTLMPESYLLGNRFSQKMSSKFILNEKKILHLIESREHSHLCWEISGQHNQLTQKNYESITIDNHCLDLFAGIYLKDGEKIKLSPIRQMILISIISAGEIGIHELALIDKVYGDNSFYVYDSGKLRTRNLIAQIKYIGFNIKREKNYFKLVFDGRDLQIILPCDHSCKDILHYLKRMNHKITAKILITDLGVKPSTAWNYIKEWKKLRLIEKDNSCGSGEYIIL